MGKFEDSMTRLEEIVNQCLYPVFRDNAITIGEADYVALGILNAKIPGLSDRAALLNNHSIRIPFSYVYGVILAHSINHDDFIVALTIIGSHRS